MQMDMFTQNLKTNLKYKDMENLTNKAKLEYFENALANGLEYICSGYGLEIDFDDENYEDASNSLTNPSYEEVLIKILKDGHRLVLVDCESDDDYIIDITDVYDRFRLVPSDHLSNMIEENDDAETADVILQTIFIGEVIFG